METHPDDDEQERDHHEDRLAEDRAEEEQDRPEHIDPDAHEQAEMCSLRGFVVPQHPRECGIGLLEPLLDCSELPVLVMAQHGGSTRSGSARAVPEASGLPVPRVRNRKPLPFKIFARLAQPARARFAL
jgi:hypothetical protein